MSDTDGPGSDLPRVLGTLGTTDHEGSDGAGVVRLRERYATDPDDLWSALTDPARLARWLGEVDGDLRPGGELRLHFLASGWEGTGRIETCERPRHLVVRTSSADAPDGVLEVRLTPDGDGTVLDLEDRGMPTDDLAAYGAGDQVHLEDLGSHLAGGGRCDARARWSELYPAYQQLPVGP